MSRSPHRDDLWSFVEVDIDSGMCSKIPELELWYACLEQGIRTVLENRPDPGHQDRNWLFWNSEYRPGSFLWICDYLGIDSDKLRTKLYKLRYGTKKGA